MTPPNHTHVISGEEKTTGRRFYIAITPSGIYSKVPHRVFASTMSRETAIGHCEKLRKRYPGSTYEPRIANFTVKPAPAR